MAWIAISLGVALIGFTILVVGRNKIIDDVGPLMNSGKLRLYDGARPADPDTAPGGTLLAELTFNTTAFAPASGGAANANAITSDTSANAGGTATYARWTNSGSTAQIDCSVTTTGGGGDIEFNTLLIVVGGTVAVSSLSLTAPTS